MKTKTPADLEVLKFQRAEGFGLCSVERALMLSISNCSIYFCISIPDTELKIWGAHFLEEPLQDKVCLSLLPPASSPGHKEGGQVESAQPRGWSHMSVDRFAVLYHLWSWEAALLQNKHQVSFFFFLQLIDLLKVTERTKEREGVREGGRDRKIFCLLVTSLNGQEGRVGPETLSGSAMWVLQVFLIISKTSVKNHSFFLKKYLFIYVFIYLKGRVRD